MTLSKIPSRALGTPLQTANYDDASVTGAKLAADAVTDKLASVYALPASPIVDLRTFMDEQYPGGWTHRTGVGVGSDAGPAIEAACDALRTAYGRGEILIPPGGTFLTKSVIDPAKLNGIVLRGLGTQASKMVFDADAGSFIKYTGAGGYTGGGVHGMTIFLEDGHPTSTARAVELEGDSVYEPSRVHMSDVDITAIGASYWYENLNCDGTARSSPQGIRVNRFFGVQCFSANHIAARFANMVQFTCIDIGSYTGTGPLANNMYITGGGTSSTNTTQATFLQIGCNGELNVTNCDTVRIEGQCGTLSASSTADYCSGWIRGTLSGSFGTNSDVTVRA